MAISDGDSVQIVIAGTVGADEAQVTHDSSTTIKVVTAHSHKVVIVPSHATKVKVVKV